MERGELLRLGPALEAFLAEFDRCAIAPTRKLIAAYVRGQLGPLPRKSVMPMALEAGIPPRTLQELLSLHRWDDDLARETLQRRVRRSLAGRPVEAYLLESAFVKRGERTPGVHRGLSRAAGKVENRVVAVHLVAASASGLRLLDSELFLPEEWVSDAARCRKAGIPAGLAYRSRGAVAIDLLRRARGHGLEFSALHLGPGLLTGKELIRSLVDLGLPYAIEADPGIRGWVRPEEGAPACTVEAAVERAARMEIVRGTAAGREPWSGAAFLFWLDLGHGMPGPAGVLSVRPPGASSQRTFIVNPFRPDDVPAVLDRALSGDAVAAEFAGEARQLGLDHFEVRSFLSLKRHFILSALSFALHAEARGSSRPAAAPRGAWAPTRALGAK